jgi:hypothetical protein
VHIVVFLLGIVVFMKDRMKPDLLPRPPASISRSRRALAQPRFLIAAMAVAMAGVAYLATAQTERAPVAMKSASASASKRKAASLADLPAMIEAYGQSRQQAASGPGMRLAAIGNGESGFNLIESDLTPGTKSDEREPVYAAGGGSIAFISNGVDANKDGRIDDAVNDENKYHVWVMNADGKNQRQITGLLAADKNRNQRHPSWAPTGTELVYADGDDDTTELYIVRPFFRGSSPTSPVEQPQRRTTIRGNKLSPTWSPTGLSIVFASNASLGSDTGGVAGQYDLFSIAPEGSDGTPASVQRLTGGTLDPLGNQTNDLNPAFSIVNPNVLYFSSDRGFNAGGTVEKLPAGRRIWDVNVSTRALTQVSNPLRRTGGRLQDVDDYPTASVTNGQIGDPSRVGERVAFQSNSVIDASDTTNDLNIWAFSRETAVFTPFTETAPRMFVSSFIGDTVFNENPLTDQPGLGYQNLGAIDAPEGVAVDGEFVYVAASVKGRVIRYLQETGNQDTSFAVADDTISKASGVITDGEFVYVGSGIGAATKTAFYRLNVRDGSSAGRTPVSAAWSGGERVAADAPSNGTEGLTFSPGNEFIFVSSYSDNRILVYERETGNFVKTFTTGTNNADNPLNGPTGLTFGPDLNDDGFQDLYVCSSNTDDVLAYMGPDPNDLAADVGNGSQAPGTFITAVVDDNNGTVSNLNAPEGIKIIPRADSTQVNIYVSSYHEIGQEGAVGGGNDVNRYQIDTATINPAVPASQKARVAGRNGAPNNATYITLPDGKGVGYFDFNVLARQSLATATGQPAPTATPLPQSTAIESNGAARVVTNILSSPDNYAASGLQVAEDKGEDKAADREPTFSRTAATKQLAARLAFASTRLYAPNPASNAKDAEKSNPYGSNGDGGTHDIWGSTAQDTTPPALIPQGTGNQLYPVIAPGVQAPFPAPRTFDEGLRPGGDLKIAVVLSDLESGIANGAVSASFSQAGKELFTSQSENVNEKIRVNLRRETPAPSIGGVALAVWDDGSPDNGGHELQANAVEGDGTYYCESTGAKAPNITGDFYMTIFARDQRGNSFTYDNIWGFTTEQFNRPTGPGNSRDLLVSDYAAGQQFPAQTGDSRFGNMFPVESYYLRNDGVQGITDDGKYVLTSEATTFDNVDVWRTLCRGPIAQSVLDAYGPNETPQIDPNEAQAGPDGPLTEQSRKVKVSTAFVIWAAPYAGTAFVGPGSLTDAVIQSRLKIFLNNGGRLFVSGRDVAFALSNNGGDGNSFLNTELGAKLAGEVNADTITAASIDTSASFVSYGNPTYDPKYYDLQIPYHFHPRGEENYGDAALTQNQWGGERRGDTTRGSVAGTKMDTITPQAVGGTTLTTAYTIDGAVVGQRIQKTRSEDVRSRAVFFSFGFEAVNRRYRYPTPDQGLPLGALNMRRNIANNIRRYFKTGSINGKVVNQLGEGVPNFLVSVRGDDGTQYLVRTDAQGGYNIIGLEQGWHVVDMAWVQGGRLSGPNAPGATTSPAGFYDATEQRIFVTGGEASNNVNLGLLADSPGSLNGRVVTSKGTPLDFEDDLVLDDKVVGMPVLVRSTGNVGTTKNGGRFAQIVTTNQGGRFTFSQVPPNVNLEVVFNPTKEDIPEESGLREGYTAPNSGPSTKVGRRVIPDVRRIDALQVPVGDTFTANDPDPELYPDPESGPAPNSKDADVAADSGIPIVVPEGPSVRGTVTLNGTPFQGATVELLDANRVPLTPARKKITLANGSYNFSDVAPGRYRLRGTLTTSDGIFATDDTNIFEVVQGQDSVVNIGFKFSSISGKVTVNGNPAKGANIQLLTGDGKVFTPSRRTTTDASGMYVLTNIPNGTYRVRATLGSQSGTADVTIDDKDVAAPDILLTQQGVSGFVRLRVDGASPKPQGGATVELVTASDNQSLQPPVTTTTGTDGGYSFEDTKPGRYKVSASYKGALIRSDPFTVESGRPVSVPDITLDLHNLQVKVVDSSNKVVSGANLTLSAPNLSDQYGVTNSGGLFTFAEIPAAKYTVTVVKTNLGASATVTVVRGEKPTLLVIKLSGDLSGADNPTSFLVKGKLYQISLPFQLLNDATKSNVSEKTGSMKAATIKVKDAFTVLPNDSRTGSLNYKLQYFDPLERKYVDIKDGETMITRGVGYLLQVINKGTELKLPQEYKNLQGLSNNATKNTFTITLHRNPSVFNDSNNGRNLIGYGFDPRLYRSATWSSKVLVTHPNGSTASLPDAVKKGWIKDQITGLNSRDTTPVTVSVTQIKPYGGYFVQTLVDGLKITFREPISSTPN